MKGLVQLFMLVLSMALLILSVSALAVEDTPVPGDDVETLTAETEVEGNSITVNVVVPTPTPTPTLDPTPIAAPAESHEPSSTPYQISSLDVHTGGGATLQEAVVGLFGDYTPRTQTITDHLQDGTTVTSQQIVPGLAGLDWPWLASVGLFALVLVSLFRLIGGLIKL